jgi:hypothetical protein
MRIQGGGLSSGDDIPGAAAADAEAGYGYSREGVDVVVVIEICSDRGEPSKSSESRTRRARNRAKSGHGMQPAPLAVEGRMREFSVRKTRLTFCAAGSRFKLWISMVEKLLRSMSSDQCLIFTTMAVFDSRLLKHTYESSHVLMERRPTTSYPPYPRCPMSWIAATPRSRH